MGDAVRHTWNNERWVIDRLVDAVETGDTEAKAKLGQRFLDGITDDRWCSWWWIDDGLFLPLRMLDPLNAEDGSLDCLYDEGIISQARDQLICEGAPLEDHELVRWREHVAELAFEAEDAEEWVLLEVQQPRTRDLYVAAILADPSGPWAGHLSFVAADWTRAATLDGLMAEGFLSPEDFQARAPAVFAELEIASPDKAIPESGVPARESDRPEQ
jgi:hypothetical protein